MNISKVTRSTKHLYTCYDAYINEEKNQSELCGNCCNYLNLPIKRKKQHEMGKRDFACKWPGAGVQETCLPEKVEKRAPNAVTDKNCNMPASAKSTSGIEQKRKKSKMQSIVAELRSSVVSSHKKYAP
jgi:hypothetical protein